MTFSSNFLIFPLACGLLVGCGRTDQATVATDAPGNGEAKRTADESRSRDRGGQRQPVEVALITRRDLAETLRVVGSLAPNETASLRPEMNGLVRSIHFEEGQRVQKGELLVKIEDSELRAQLAQSQSRLDLAQLNLARAETLRGTKSNTEADVDRSRSEFANAKAEVDLLKVRLARTEVRAPFDGVTAARMVSPGDYVNTQSVLTTINDLSRLKVEFQVPERYLAKVNSGTTFTLKSTVGETTNTAAGQVYFVNAVIDRNTRSSGVKGYLTDNLGALKAGMFAVIEIVLEVHKGALTVPEGAILMDQRGPQLVVVNGPAGASVAEFVPVKLGLRSRGVVEIRPVTGELKETQQVVAAGVGSLALYPGAKLEPVPQRAEFRIDDNNS